MIPSALTDETRFGGFAVPDMPDGCELFLPGLALLALYVVHSAKGMTTYFCCLESTDWTLSFSSACLCLGIKHQALGLIHDLRSERPGSSMLVTSSTGI